METKEKELSRSERAKQLLEVGDKELSRSERANWIIEAMEFLGLIEFTDDPNTPEPAGKAMI